MTPGDLRDPLTSHRLLSAAYRTLQEGGEVTGAVSGEFVLWTSSSRLFDTRSLRAFIMKSIISFIICISTTICGGLVFAMDGRLVSCHSCLLGALLPSGPSRSLLSALVPFCSFP